MLKCPLCHGEFPLGARVCRGCQGTVTYGVPQWGKMAVVCSAVWAGIIGLNFLPHGTSPAALVIGFIVGGGMYLTLRERFKDRYYVSRPF